MKTSLNKAALRSATCIAAFAISTTCAYAQESSAAADQADTATAGQSIVVTGSRIRQPNLTSAAPVTIVDAQEFQNTGTTRVEDLMNSLPQVFAGQGGAVSNGATGTATLNLRNLGSERTLILVNGRRLMPGDPTSAAADINAIPGALIKRVDVLTGGASATYGSDAVAGVVNFIMDTDFQGFKVDSQYSFYQHNNDAGSDVTDPLNARGFDYPKGNSANGGTFDTTLSFGTGFDDNRGHITAYVGYRKINAVLQGSRDYSSCALRGSQATGFSCGGSATSANGTIYTGKDGSGPIYQVDPAGSQTLIPGSTLYNYNPLNYFQRPDERYTAGFFANYNINDSMRPYAEFMFMDDRTVAQIAPSGNFGNTSLINCDNPLLSAQQSSILCAPGNIAGTAIDPTTGAVYNQGYAQIYRRNVEGGGRSDDLQHTSYRAVLGMNGDLSPAWSYDAYYQYGRTNFAETYSNDFSITRLGRALDVVTDPTTGAAVCRSVLSGVDKGCVPYNIFQTGQVSQAAIDYLQTPGFQRGYTSEQVLSGSITGDLTTYGIKTPWAQDGLGVVFGGEYRKESLQLMTDTAFQTGDLAGQGAATLPVKGSFNVKEFFTEARLPIIQDGFIKEFSIDAGYRYSSYKNAQNKFSTNTFKVEGTLAPTADIAFRGGFNRAVRAPTVQDLFAPSRVALDGNTDYCAGATPEYTAAQCANMGVTAAQYGRIAENPSQQYNGLIGGNADLKPEIANTFTAGVVLTPTFVRGLAITVDYFHIKVKDAIQSIGADTILDTCANTGDTFICSLIKRNSGGSLWQTTDGYVVDTQQNIGSLKTSGIDVNASYAVELGPKAGKLNLTMMGTYLKSLDTDTGVGTVYKCAGQFGSTCGIPTPKWRHQARISWDLPSGIGLSARWRYFGKVNDDADNDHLGAQSFFDFNLSARIGDHSTWRLGVNNAFDRQPPLSGHVSSVFGNGNTYPQVYDALGRYIFTGITLDF